MFKTKKQKRLEELEKENIDLKSDLTSLSEENKNLETEVYNLQEELDSLHSTIEFNSNKTSLTIDFDNNLETIRPTTKVTEDTIMKLIERQYLASNQKEDEFAIHLALMVLTVNAIDGILANYEEEVSKEEHEVFDDNDDL